MWATGLIFLLYKFKGKFFKKVLSYYRQHDNNMSTLIKYDEERLNNLINIKIEHLNYFQNYSKINYKKEIKNLNKIKKKITRKKYYKKISEKIIKHRCYWWDF